VSIGCGVIDIAGQLVVRLVDSMTSDVVAQSSIVDVSWPSSVTLRVPNSQRALSDDLVVTLNVGHGVLCQSQHSQVSYTLRLIYLGVNDSSHSTVVFNQTLTRLPSPPSDVVVSCSLIDRAGLYQAMLVSSRQPDLPVAVSNVVVVSWSDYYSLSMSSLSPCHQHVVVRHTQPRCNHVVYTVRVLARQLPSNSDNNNNNNRMASDWRYVSKRSVKSSKTSVSFKCALFQQQNSVYDEYCVLLLSTASDDSVYAHRRFCTSSPSHRHTG